MIPFEDIDQRLKDLGKDRIWLANETGRSEGSIRAALAPNAAPDRRSKLLQRALTDAIEQEEGYQKTKPSLPDRISVEASPESLALWSRAFKNSEFETFEEWMVNAINEEAEEWHAEQQRKNLSVVTGEDPPTYFEVPCMGIAAGHAIIGDELDPVSITEDLGEGHVAFIVCGPSMEPEIEDGSTILVKEPHVLRNHHMKKGLIYAVEIGGERTLKRYNTRPATDEEMESEAEYIYTINGYKRVKILESINPDYKEIIIDQETRMIGWYDPSIQHLVAK